MTGAALFLPKPISATFGSSANFDSAHSNSADLLKAAESDVGTENLALSIGYGLLPKCRRTSETQKYARWLIFNNK
jgi:hypothetical protein